MADESISVEIKDGVDKGVARNISEIATQARNAYQNVDKLVKQLNRVKPAGLDQVSRAVGNAQRQMQAAALSSQRLATETQRTAAASANAARATQGLATATARTAQAETAAAGAALRLEAAQDRAAASSQRQAAAASKAAAATAAQTQKLAAQTTEVNRVQGIHDRFNAVLARSPQHQKAFSSQAAEMAKKSGLARHELTNLAAQVNDVVVSLGSGQKPMQVFLQQGAQIGQIFGNSGLGAGAILRQLGGIVGSLLVRLAPFAAVISAALIPFSLFNCQINEGFNEEKYLKSLKLTEDQLKKLKKSGEELSVTFGDTFKATFQVIGGYAAAFFKPATDKIVKWWNNALDWMTNAVSMFVRATLGLFIALPNVVKAVFKDIPASLELMFKTAANNIISTIESLLNMIGQAIASSGLGKFLGVDGPVKIELPRLQLSDGAKSVSDDITKALDAGFASADKMVDKFAADVAAQAKKNRDARVRAAAGEDDSASNKKTGFDRAKELAQINAELDAQAKHMFTLSTARDAANRAEEIALRFAKEGKPLRDDEITALRNKIQALNDAKEIQTQFDRIFNAAIGPQREYNASLAAAEKLLKMGAISQAQYTAEIARAEDAYKNASDPLFQINKELDEQIKLLRMLGPERSIEQQVMQAQNKALSEGKPLREDELNALREKLKLVQQMNIQAQIADDLQANSLAQQSINRQDKTAGAIGQVGVNGFTGVDAVAQLGQDNPALQATQAFAMAQIATYTDMYAQIEELRQADILSDRDAQLAKFALFQQQSQQYLDAASNIFGSLTQLQGSENKKQAAIGKKAAIAETVINTYKSATAAFSSLAGIPIVGPVLGGIAAGAAVAAGMANIQKIKSQGYKEGGYTGNIPTNAIAGPVHGQEFVFDAPSTSRIGVGNLEALRRGRIPANLQNGASASDSSGTTVQAGDKQTNFNQTVNVTVQGRRTSKTVDQTARAIRRESTKQLIRDGG